MTEPTGGWGPCPPGELGRLSALLAFRRRVRNAVAAGVVLLATAAVAGAGWLTYSALRSDADKSKSDDCPAPVAVPRPPSPGTPKVPAGQ